MATVRKNNVLSSKYNLMGVYELELCTQIGYITAPYV
jgi:hypothetical protein